MSGLTDEQAAAARIVDSLKSARATKEAFYANHSGGSITEINIVTSIAPITFFIYAALTARKALFQNNEYSPPLFLVDFALNVAALLLSITLYASHSAAFAFMLLANVLLIFASPIRMPKQVRRPPPAPVVPSKKDDDAPKTTGKSVEQLLPKKAFITVWRGGMMVITCLAILAVDFPVFPRRFAKVETWGTSLMDLGVGSFVFANGVATARSTLRNAHSSSPTPFSTRLLTALRSSLALLAIGLIRLLATKSVDYHEHVSEYGLHWNFFITLGLLPPITVLLQPLLTQLHFPEFLSLAIGAAFQSALLRTNLQTWALLADRTTLISANKEGITSFIGYLSIFLAGQATGLRILPAQNIPKASSNPSFLAKRPLLTPLFLQGTVWTVMYLVSVDYFGMNLQVSRRLANLPYCAWVSAYNCFQLLAFYLIESFVFGEPEARFTGKTISVPAATYEERAPRLLRAFNRNGLVVFLLANLMTGGINLKMDTIGATTLDSMGTLFAYALILSAIVVGMDLKDITVKL